MAEINFEDGRKMKPFFLTRGTGGIRVKPKVWAFCQIRSLPAVTWNKMNKARTGERKIETFETHTFAALKKFLRRQIYQSL